MYGHYTGRSIHATMKRGNDTHQITKWEFDTTSREVDKNWTHLSYNATRTRNRITICERGNYLVKRHL